MLSVILPDSEYRTLITSHGDLGNSYFMCPRAGVSFYFDHFKHSVSDIKPIEDNERSDLELWRRSLEEYATIYVNEHFLNGALSVYLTKSTEGHQIILCIQADFCKNVSYVYLLFLCLIQIFVYIYAKSLQFILRVYFEFKQFIF